MSSTTVHNPALLKQERHALLIEELRREGKILAGELSARLNVSEDTIRRDLRELARDRKLLRVHGGALPRPPGAAAFQARRSQASAAKAAIGQAAAKLIQDGQLVFMDGGTTTLHTAQHLPQDLSATIVTNSPPLAIALAGHERVQVVLLGGRFSKEAQITMGAVTLTQVQSFRADLCLLGICSLHPEIGLSVPDLEEAEIKRTMIARSAEVAGLVSAEKLGTALPYVVGPARALTYLFTDSGASPSDLEPYTALGIVTRIS